MSSKNLVAVMTAAKTPLQVEEQPIPLPGPGEVLIRNHAIALNPIDWKRWASGLMIPFYPFILGQDVSGVVAAVGSDVTAFKPGDRVIGSADGIHTSEVTHTAFQTYTVTRVTTTAKIPDAVSFLAASTAVSGVATAAMALFDVLGLPYPEITAKPADVPKKGEGILVWGGASSVGSMTIQLARLSGLTIFATASARHHDWLRSLGADVVLDYGVATVVDDVVAAAKRTGTPIRWAVDAISMPETLGPAMKVLTASGAGKDLKLVHTLPWPKDFAVAEGIGETWVQGGDQWGRREDLGVWLFGKALPVWLGNGGVAPGPYRVIEGGIRGLQTALEVLMKGVSGEEVVVEVE